MTGAHGADESGPPGGDHEVWQCRAVAPATETRLRAGLTHDDAIRLMHKADRDYRRTDPRLIHQVRDRTGRIVATSSASLG